MDDDVERLVQIDAESGDLLVASGIRSLAYALTAGVLLYLYRVAKQRRPELPRVALVLAIAGPVAYAIVGFLIQLVQIDAARDFLSSGPRTEDRAGDLLRGGSVRDVSLFGLFPSVALGLAFVLVNLHAMRAGLVSRFMGILGIVIGVFFVLPLLGAGGPPFVQLFWLAALGALFLGRWPGGRGPAWESGRPEPWPSALERARERDEALGRSSREGAAAEAQAAPARRSSKKRKRKRRR